MSTKEPKQETLSTAAKKAKVAGAPTLFLKGRWVQSRSEEATKKEIETPLKGKKKSW